MKELPEGSVRINVNKPMSTETKTTIRNLSARLRAVLLGGALILAGGSLAFTKWNTASPAASGGGIVPVRLEVDAAPIARGGWFIPSFAPIVKQVSPSVVKVFASARIPTSSRQAMPQEELFRRFFGLDLDEAPQRGPRPQPRREGLGSGVIVTKDGYILTNNHVVEGADEIKIAMNDGRDFTAKLIGRDPKTDIAVLKVEADDLPHLSLTDSDNTEVGDLVLAIGNPFGIGQTVTMGMVSAKGRTLPSMDHENRYEDFIQTDAAINPGNSGGALVDAEGRLVGINTAIYSGNTFGGVGGNIGIGFAVPSNLARFAMESIIKDGRVVRGFLGVSLQPLTELLAKQFELKNADGALVTDMVPKGPAERAGFKSGDVIVEFDSKPVKDSRTLRLQVAQVAPGKKVPVKIVRDGRAKTIEVALQEFPDNEVAMRTKPRAESKSDSLDGVTVSDLDNATRRNLPGEVPRDLQGAVVVQMDPQSPAAKAGLREGDIILEINRKPVRDADEAVRLSEGVKQETVLLKVWSRGMIEFLVVKERLK